MFSMRRVVTLSLWMVVLLAALCVVLFAATIYTYERLTAETLIAELRFDPAGERRFTAHLRTGDRCEERVYPLLGEQFRIDAEFLKWKYWALLLGLDSQYRLDRLEGRYRSAAEQNAEPNLAHDLGERNAIDLVELVGALGTWNFLLDATYGSSTYEDIDVGRVYSIYRTTAGIITRSVPRPAALPPGESFTVTINGACGAPSWWQRFAAATDSQVVAALDFISSDRS
jgi:hypothetical protein